MTEGFGKGFTFKAIIATLLSWIESIPTIVVTLILLMTLDFVVGIIRAWSEGDVSSAVCRRGIARKAMMLIVPLAFDKISLVFGLQVTLPHPFGSVTFGTWLAAFYCVSEAISIIENTSSYVPYPKGLVRRLRVMRNRIEEGTEVNPGRGKERGKTSWYKQV